MIIKTLSHELFDTNCYKLDVVSQFIYDFYNQDNIYDEENFKRFNSHIRPNNHVLRLLKRYFYEKNNLFVNENVDFKKNSLEKICFL